MQATRSRPFEGQSPRGGWFEPDNTSGRRRVVYASKVAGAVVGLTIAVGGVMSALALLPTTPGEVHPAFLAAAALPAGGLAYVLTHSAALAITGISWRDMLHDMRLRSVWAVLLEATLFLLTAGMMLFSLIDAVKTHSLYSASVFVLLACLTWWPLIRHRIRGGRWPD